MEIFMKISGIQKLTLLDFPGRCACTVFTGGCNFICPFCHNSELLGADTPQIMDDGELIDFLASRRSLLDGVCISGGEPTLQADLLDVMAKIKELDYAIKLDTNGYRPDILKKAVALHLCDYVAMDIKSDANGYAEVAGVSNINMNHIRESIDFLLSGAVDYEFRTTVVDELHDEKAILGITEFFKNTKAKRYFIQPFADRDTVCFSNFHAPSDDKMRKFLDILSPFANSVQIRG